MRKLPVWWGRGLTFLAGLLPFALSGALSTCAASSGPRASSSPPKKSEPKLRLESVPGAEIRRNPSTRAITSIRAENLSITLERNESFRTVQKKSDPVEIALTFLHAYRDSFHLQNPRAELAKKSSQTDDLGLTHVRFGQIFKRIPVWAAEILVHLDRSKHIYLIQGAYVPTPARLTTAPKLTADDAQRRVARHIEGLGEGCNRCQAELVIRPEDAGPRLVYRVLATPKPDRGWEVFVDAETGNIIDKIPTVFTGGVSPPSSGG